MVAVVFLGLCYLQKVSHRLYQLRAFPPPTDTTFSGSGRMAETNCHITSSPHGSRFQTKQVKVVGLTTGNPRPLMVTIPTEGRWQLPAGGCWLWGMLSPAGPCHRQHYHSDMETKASPPMATTGLLIRDIGSLCSNTSLSREKSGTHRPGQGQRTPL